MTFAGPAARVLPRTTLPSSTHRGRPRCHGPRPEKPSTTSCMAWASTQTFAVGLTCACPAPHGEPPMHCQGAGRGLSAHNTRPTSLPARICPMFETLQPAIVWQHFATPVPNPSPIQARRGLARSLWCNGRKRVNSRPSLTSLAISSFASPASAGCEQTPAWCHKPTSIWCARRTRARTRLHT